MNLETLTHDDIEELDSLNIKLTKWSSRETVLGAVATVKEKLSALRTGFYGRDRLVKDWIEHMRELRDKLKSIAASKREK